MNTTAPNVAAAKKANPMLPEFMVFRKMRACTATRYRAAREMQTPDHPPRLNSPTIKSSASRIIVRGRPKARICSKGKTRGGANPSHSLSNLPKEEVKQQREKSDQA